MKFVIPFKYLQTALLFSAKNDVRPYLNGIHIKNGMVEATNGHIACRIDSGQIEFDSHEEDYILPYNMAKLIVQNHKKTSPFVVCHDNIVGDMFYLIDSRSVNWTGYGAFPKMDHFFSKECNNEIAQFDPDYLLLFKKASKLLGNKAGGFQVHHNGNSHCNVTIPDYYEFRGVLMPWRI